MNLMILLASLLSSDPALANCVNPGGSCNGTIPCCDSYNNACVRGRCMRIDTPGALGNVLPVSGKSLETYLAKESRASQASESPANCGAYYGL